MAVKVVNRMEERILRAMKKDRKSKRKGKTDLMSWGCFFLFTSDRFLGGRNM